MKRSATVTFLVVAVHLSVLMAAVTLVQQPVAKVADKVIQGAIIAAPVVAAVAAPAQPQQRNRKTELPVQAKAEPVKPRPTKTHQPKPKAVAKAAAVPLAAATPALAAAQTSVVTKAEAKAIQPQAKPDESITAPVPSASSAINKAPKYPMLSRKLKEQGTVFLHVLVLRNGKVGQLNIKQSSGFSRLDQAAINTVRSWRYQPAEKLGQTIDFWLVQPVVFNLNSIP